MTSMKASQLVLFLITAAYGTMHSFKKGQVTYISFFSYLKALAANPTPAPVARSRFTMRQSEVLFSRSLLSIIAYAYAHRFLSIDDAGFCLSSGVIVPCSAAPSQSA